MCFAFIYVHVLTLCVCRVTTSAQTDSFSLTYTHYWYENTKVVLEPHWPLRLLCIWLLVVGSTPTRQEVVATVSESSRTLVSPLETACKLNALPTKRKYINFKVWLACKKTLTCNGMNNNLSTTQIRLQSRLKGLFSNRSYVSNIFAKHKYTTTSPQYSLSHEVTIVQGWFQLATTKKKTSLDIGWGGGGGGCKVTTSH